MIQSKTNYHMFRPIPRVLSLLGLGLWVGITVPGVVLASPTEAPAQSQKITPVTSAGSGTLPDWTNKNMANTSQKRQKPEKFHPGPPVQPIWPPRPSPTPIPRPIPKPVPGPTLPEEPAHTRQARMRDAVQAYAAAIAKAPDRARVQVALLLDTSNSMDGLIDQAKTQLWSIVNELARARRRGADVIFGVALYEYGQSTISAEEGHLRLVCPMTTDLDLISESLFALRTRGGEEYCGQVIQSALGGLPWSARAEDLRLMFVAGNEPFSQGQVDYRSAVDRAVKKDVVVNTIFCGNYTEGVRTYWQDGAVRGKGKYVNIDHTKKIHIRCPQDDRLLRLNRELNDTYVGFGSLGKSFKKRQMQQDVNAETLGNFSAASRVASKGSRLYRNERWDVVDGVKEGTLDLESAEESTLPQPMKGMTVDQRKAYVKKLANLRKRIQSEIGTLSKERAQYIKQERAKRGEESLDTAILSAIRSLAEKKQYSFK